MMQEFAMLCVVVSICVAHLTFSLGDIIRVLPDCDQQDRKTTASLYNDSIFGLEVCYELDEVFNGDLELLNNVIVLSSGMHNFSSPKAIVNLTNVTFTGEVEDQVTVECMEGYGFAFLNSTDLHISNIMFSRCGLTGSTLSNSVNYLRNFMELHFYVPLVLKIGVLIGMCKNLVLTNVVVSNTSGIGLVGINILGHSKIVGSKFEDNKSPYCENSSTIPLELLNNNSKIYDQIGGGIYLLYLDIHERPKERNVSLSILNSYFASNEECGYSGYININYQYFSNIKKLQYMLGAGGGLSIFAVQHDYSLHVSVRRSTFYKNVATYGSAVHIGLFAHSLFNQITFSKCNFHHNGYLQAMRGAGIAVFLNLYENFYPDSEFHRCHFCKIVSVLDSNFTENSAAGQGGGVLAYSVANFGLTNYSLDDYNNIMSLKRCLFLNNKAEFGAALYASQRVSHGVDGLFGIKVEDVIVKNSSIGDIKLNTKRVSNNFASIVDLRSVNLILEKGELSIQNSDASALLISSSTILMKNNSLLSLRNNHGSRGGGLFLMGYTPTIVVSHNCTLNFIGNRASARGGAIYYVNTFSNLNNLYPLNEGDCFIFGSSIYLDMNGDGNIFNADNTINFKDNEAPFGSIIYGSSFKVCPWAAPFITNNSDNIFTELNHTSTFKFSELPTTIKQVSSEPSSVIISSCNSVEILPGQPVNISLSVVDVFNAEIDTVLVIDYFIVGDNSGNNRSINDFEFIYKTASNPNITVAMPAIRNHEIIVTVYTESNSVGDSCNVTIQDCPFGFSFTSSDDLGTCQCEYSNLSLVHCNDENYTITVIGGSWLGCLTEDCMDFGDLVVRPCLFGYCDSRDSLYFKHNTSNQCFDGSNRGGVMCGECEPGFSITYGSICLHCGTVDIVIQVLYLLFTIFAIFFNISVIKVTVDKEWVSIVYFYCSIVFPYEFFRNRDFHHLARALYPALIFGQERYSNRCVYMGLTALHRSAFSLLFCTFLLIALGIFAAVCHYSSYISEHLSPAKTIMTFAYGFYVTVFKLCIEILAPIQLTSINRRVFEIRWAIDPNVRYFLDPLHGVLMTISILIFIFYLILGVILLLFPTQMYKHFKSFYPFLDIIWAPYKTKYRFWASIRLLFGISMGALARYSNHNVIPIGITIIAVFLYVQSMIQPFKARLANILDNFFLCIVHGMHIIAFLLYKEEDIAIQEGLSWLAVALLIFSYIVAFLSFLWYWRSSIKFLFNKVTQCIRKVYFYHKKKPAVSTVVEIASSEPTHNTLSFQRRVVPDYSKYRESIISN